MVDPYDRVDAEDHVPFHGRSTPSNVLPNDLLGLLITTGVRPAGRVLGHIERLAVPSDRGEALVAVAPYLPDEVVGRALDLARTVASDQARATALAGLGPYLSAHLLGEAWTFAGAIPDPIERATALTALARHLSGARDETVFPEVLAAARVIAPAMRLKDLLTGLSVDLREALLREAFPIAEIQPWQWPHLPTEVLVEHYDAVPEAVRVTLLGDLARLLPTRLLDRAWVEAEAATSPYTRAAALTALAPLLPAARRETALLDAWSAVQAMPYPSEKYLARLARHLPAEQQEQAYRQAIVTAERRPYLRDRPSALTELVPLLPDGLRGFGVRTALDAVLAARHSGWRAFDICRLGPYLPAQLLPEALTAILTADREQWRADGLAFIAQYLPPDLLDRAAESASAMTDPYWQAFAIAHIAPHLPEARRINAVATLPILAGKP